MIKVAIVANFVVVIVCLCLFFLFELILPKTSELIVRDWESRGIIVDRQVADAYPEYANDIRKGLGNHLTASLVYPGVLAYRCLSVMTILNFAVLLIVNTQYTKICNRSQILQ